MMFLEDLLNIYIFNCCIIYFNNVPTFEAFEANI